MMAKVEGSDGKQQETKTYIFVAGNIINGNPGAKATGYTTFSQ
jgi:hypothetical protein